MVRDNIIPSYWKEEQLSDVCEIIMGQSPQGSSYNKNHIGLPLLNGATDMGEYMPLINSWTTEPTKIAKKNDILLAIRATIGDVNISDREYCLGRGIAAIRPKQGLESKYLYYFIATVGHKLKHLSSGSTIKNIKKANLDELRIPIPPIHTQKKIIQILDTSVEIKSKRKKTIEFTNRLKQFIFVKLFGDLEEEQNYESEKLEDCCKNIIDTPHYTVEYFDSGVPVIRTSDIEPGRINFKQTKFTSIKEYEKRRERISPQIGDVLYTREAPWGIAAPVNHTDFTVGQRIVLLRPNNDKLNTYFFTFLLNSKYVYRQAKKAATSTTTEHVNIKDIRNFKIPLPDLETQNKFESIIRKTELIVEKLELSFNKAALLHDGLQSKIFSGEIVK